MKERLAKEGIQYLDPIYGGDEDHCDVRVSLHISLPTLQIDCDFGLFVPLYPTAEDNARVPTSTIFFVSELGLSLLYSHTVFCPPLSC